MIIDGKAIAEDIYSDLAPKFASLSKKPKLGIVVVGAHPVIESLVRINVSDKSDAGKIQQAVNRMVANTDAVIVQLPLPQGVDANEVLAAVPNEKDVDALNPRVAEEERLVHAPVALAVVEILKRAGIETAVGG